MIRAAIRDARTAFRFTGKPFDESIGLTYFGARYYDHYIARWTQPDTIVPQPGNPQSLNRYTYALNNPLRYTDPTGHFSEDELLAGCDVPPGRSRTPIP